MGRLHALEGHHDEVKQELEKSIQSLRGQISKYDAEYQKNMEVLSAIADNLMNLLRNVSTSFFFSCLHDIGNSVLVVQKLPLPVFV